MEKTYQGATGQRYSSLVIQNVTLINGLGTPPEGPVDILIKGDTIADVRRTDPVTLGRVGPGGKSPDAEHVIDGTGMYALPGLVNMHAHPAIGDVKCGPRGSEYAYKLWLAHGVTTLRSCGLEGPDEFYYEQRRLSQKNPSLAIPRLIVFHTYPADQWHTPEEAREIVRSFKEAGADGVKIHARSATSFEVFAAICDEAKKLGMRGAATHLGLSSEVNAVMASQAGVSSIEHWYGVNRAALPGTQRFPEDYNEMDELSRFRWSGRLWKEADQYPEEMAEVLDLLIENGTVWDPTMSCYDTNRDLERAKRLPWHDRYTVSSLMNHWLPQIGKHATFHFDWKTSDEIAWKENFIIWMKYVKMFFDLGGTLTVGTDEGWLFNLYGFGTIRELELMQEAGIHPIDIIKIATTNATGSLGLDNLARGVQPGYTADLAIVDGNPLDNFKVMYGTGLEKFSEDRTEKVMRGGVKWTIRDGVVFDAPALLHDVEDYVSEMKGK